MRSRIGAGQSAVSLIRSRLRQSGDFGADWTARDRATWWVLIAWLLLRVVYLVNGLVLLATGWSVFAHRWMQLGLMIAIAAETAVLVPVTLRRRSYSSAAVIWADVTVVCVGLVLNGHALGPGVVDSGLNWFFAVSLGSAVGAAVGLPPLQAVVAVPAIGLAHCLPVARSWTGSGAAGGVQALAYALIGWLLVRQLQRIAAETDVARADAVRLAAELERERTRHLVHDPAAVLSLLARNDLTADVAEVARRQSAVLAGELRRFLAAEPEPAVPLARALLRLGDEFADLPLTVTVDEVERDLPERVSRAVVAAARTALVNVRSYAHAREVVLHARVDDTGWEVSVSDDGVGFDPVSRAFGYGLREIVTAGIRHVGGKATVESEPGAGTFVLLRSAGQIAGGDA